MKISLTASTGGTVHIPVDEIETIQVINDSISIRAIIITSDAEEIHVMDSLEEIAAKIASPQEESFSDRFTL